MTKPLTIPPGFSPIDTLYSEGRVVDLLNRDGEVVRGWLFRGVPGEGRTFWTRSAHGYSERVDAIAWAPASETERKAA